MVVASLVMALYVFDFEMAVYCSCTCYTSGSSQKHPMKQGLSILSSCHLHDCFLGIGSLDFSEFWHGARNPYKVVHENPNFWKNFFCFKNWGKGPKSGFLNLKKNLVISFHRIYSIMKILLFAVFINNPIFGKNLTSEIQAKTLSANQIAGFLNHLFLQNKLIKQPHFQHVDTNSQKLKIDFNFFGWACSKVDMANLVFGL